MEKSWIIGAIIGLIVGGIIVGLYFSNNIEKNNGGVSTQINQVIKNPFGFECWGTLNVETVSFQIKTETQSGLTVNDCSIYLRNNYETPNYWADSENKYQCILDRVIYWGTSDIRGDCRCEYRKV